MIKYTLRDIEYLKERIQLSKPTIIKNIQTVVKSNNVLPRRIISHGKLGAKYIVLKQKESGKQFFSVKSLNREISLELYSEEDFESLGEDEIIIPINEIKEEVFDFSNAIKKELLIKEKN